MRLTRGAAVKSLSIAIANFVESDMSIPKTVLQIITPSFFSQVSSLL